MCKNLVENFHSFLPLLLFQVSLPADVSSSSSSSSSDEDSGSETTPTPTTPTPHSHHQYPPRPPTPSSIDEDEEKSPLTPDSATSSRGSSGSGLRLTISKALLPPSTVQQLGGRGAGDKGQSCVCI